VPDGARAVGDHPEGAPVDQAGRAAVDGGHGDAVTPVHAELDDLGVLAELDRRGVFGRDGLVRRVVDLAALVREQLSQVLGTAADPVGVVLDKQLVSPSNRCGRGSPAGV
jgi:hypothetical protein